MEFALALREVTRRPWVVGIGVLLAAFVAVLSVYRLDGLALKPRSLQYSSASTQVLVDSQSSVLGNESQNFEPLVSRAAVYANFMTSPVVLNLIGSQIGLSGEQIYAAGPVNANEPRVEQEPTALKRNIELTGETKPYRLNFETQTNAPTININSQAPTTKLAAGLANAAAVGMQQYVAGVEAANHVQPNSRIVVRQLGVAKGSVVDGGIRKSLAVMTFIAVFVLWCLLVVAVPRIRAIWRASDGLQVAGDSPSGNAYDGDGRGEAASGDIHTDPFESPLFDPADPRDDRRAVPARSMR